MAYVQKGKGKHLLLLHGYLSSKEAFAAQIEYFSKFFRVTAIDFIGFGNSTSLTMPFSVGEYAKWLQAVMEQLKLQKPHVIAHSFGCRVAVKAASENADLFDKIVLTGPAGIIVNRGFKYKCKVRVYRLVKRFFPRFAERRFGSKEYRSLSPIMKESYKKIVNEDLRGCAQKVKNQVLIVQGESDEVTTLKEAKVYESAFENGKLVKMQGGHFAFAERPLVFNLAVEEFLYG